MRACACVCVCVNVYAFTRVCVCMSVYSCVCVSVCVILATFAPGTPTTSSSYRHYPTLTIINDCHKHTNKNCEVFFHPFIRHLLPFNLITRSAVSGGDLLLDRQEQDS